MKSFREWQEKQSVAPLKQEAWKMSKDDIVKHWQQLQPGMPLAQLRVIPPEHKGSTYRYDGIRVTGSSQFINSIMSRMKELMEYESATTRLSVVYHQQVDSKLQEPIPDSYVFYIQVKDREIHQHKLNNAIF